MFENTQQEVPKPVAFMVMPFRERIVPNPPKGAPAKIDCDALWEKAFRPALEDLGYLPIRADMEVGAVIVKDMLERLALSELVLADLTLPNGNVYYEVGMRHVAKETHCVLIAADWSRQLFDADQMRSDRYPLKNGSVPDEEAQVIRNMLVELIPRKQNSPTPYYELVKGKEDATVFRQQIEKINGFQTKIRGIRLQNNKQKQKSSLHQLLKDTSKASRFIPEVGLELLMLVRDISGWKGVQEYADTLPPTLKDCAFVKEQLLLSRSKQGDRPEAIAGLEELIESYGDNAERRGLIGGRYKKMWRDLRHKREESNSAEASLEEIGYLDSAIESYTLGMELDFNEYYCASNLPNLLRTRGEDDDENQAKFIDQMVLKICERKIDRGEDDGWVKSTLLGAAFRSENIKKVKQLARDVAKQGPADWELNSILEDIGNAIDNVTNKKLKQELDKIRNQLVGLLEKH